ncbi:MAG: CDP-alcohol phosphatidyltransferase family protein [Ectothiorhodospiraceae bacterium]
MTLRQLPNLITGLRIVLVPPIVILILRHEYSLALILFIAAGVSDALDGTLARVGRWQTALGGVLDPVADKLLVFGVFLSLVLAGRMPEWLFAAALLRDLVIGAGALAYRLRIGPFAPAPSLLSKLNTLLQLSVVFVLLLPWPGGTPTASLVDGLFVLTGISIVASGAGYVLEWGQRAAAVRRERLTAASKRADSAIAHRHR